MANVLIAGGSGLVGQRMSEILREEGYQVSHLSRKQNLSAEFPAYKWDLQEGVVDMEAVAKADFVVNLAGASIIGRPWTKARKKVIIDSRVKTNEVLSNAFSQLDKKPKAYLSASAVGYYGNTGDRMATETSEPGVGFLTDSVLEWEKSIEMIEDLGIRTAVFRIGIVLSTLGGAFQKMFPTYHLHTGGYFGDGQQFYSWIHIDDLARMFLHAMQKENFAGTYNAVGPNPMRLKDIAKAIGTAMNKKTLLLPIPAFVLKTIMGEMSEMLLFSTRVSSQKIEDSGFKFQFPELVEAVRDVRAKNI